LADLSGLTTSKLCTFDYSGIRFSITQLGRYLGNSLDREVSILGRS
jgi:hypothetical protein